MNSQNNVVRVLTCENENLYEYMISINEDKWKKLECQLIEYHRIGAYKYYSNHFLSKGERLKEIMNKSGCTKVISFSVNEIRNDLPPTLGLDLYSYKIEVTIKKNTLIYQYIKEENGLTMLKHIYHWYGSSIDSSIFDLDQKEDILNQIRDALIFNKRERLSMNDLYRCISVPDSDFSTRLNQLIQRSEENTEVISLFCKEKCKRKIK